MMVMMVLLPVYAAPLSVSIGKSAYSPGETVTVIIQGKPSADYAIEVRAPDGRLVLVDEVRAGPDGSVTYSFSLPSDSPAGEYKVRVAGGGEYVEVSFMVSAASSPSPTPYTTPSQASSAAAASALSTAKSRLAQLSKALSSLNASLAPLGLEGVLANASSALAALSAKLSEAEAKYSAGDYDAAYRLASEVSSECVKLLGQIFGAAVQALRGLVAKVSAASNDSLVPSLLSLANKSLDEVSPTYVDSSLASIDLACKLVMAASRLAGVADLEAKLGQLASQLNATVRELERLRSEADALRARASELEKERSSLSQRVSELSSELSAAQSRVNSLTAENQQLRGQVSQLEQRVADLEQQVSRTNLLSIIAGAVLAAAGFVSGYLLARKKE